MKRKFICFIILMIGLFPILVKAEEVKVLIPSDTLIPTNTLIPIDTKVNVNTEKFNYNGITYNSNLDEKGRSIITFDSIKNNYKTKTPISINILLFGNDKKNIGLVSYCTDKDLDSNYSGYKLSGEGSSSFSITMLSKYFVEGKTSKDVKYIAVLDDNKYCHVGGYTNYKDKSLNEIVNGNTKELNPVEKIIMYIQDNKLEKSIILIAGGLILFIILIMVLKAIKKKSKNKPVVYKPQDDKPIEETLDLSYDNATLDENTTNTIDVSMGGSDTNSNENKNIEVPQKEEKEEESDLTKFFN